MKREYNLADPKDVALLSDRQRDKNELVYLLRAITMAISTHLTSGAFLTTFMLFIGLNTQKISVINFAQQMGLFAASILILYVYNLDKSGLGIIRIGSFGGLLSNCGMLIASFLYLRSPDTAHLLLVVIGFLASAASSMRNSAEIKAVPMLFDGSGYTSLVARCGYIGGAVTLLVTLTTMYLLKSNESIGYYRIFFAISTLILTVYAVLGQFFKKPLDQERAADVKVSYRKVFTGKFLMHAVPHLLRGVGSAGYALWPAVIMSHLDMTPMLSSLLIPLTIAADILGSLIYVRIGKRFRSGTLTMGAFVLSAVFLFMTPIIRTIPVFFICYFLNYTLVGCLNKALVPSLVFSTDAEDLPLISSLHVLYYAMANMPAVLILGKYMDRYTLPCMLTAGCVYIIGGLVWRHMYNAPVK